MGTPAARIPLQAIQFSHILGIGYDEARRVLAVEFEGGAIYHYADVPIETHEQLIVAESRGVFLAKHIKGHYPSVKMTRECGACGLLEHLDEPHDHREDTL